jgi:hypothetical protein
MSRLRECIAEAAGVFFYVFPGIAAIASFTVNTAGPLPVPFYGNILQVGFAFALVSSYRFSLTSPLFPQRETHTEREREREKPLFLKHNFRP